VTFRWRDSADHNKQKLMTLDAIEFMRRFLLHILPPGFVKIRHFGFLANGNRGSALFAGGPNSDHPPPVSNFRMRGDTGTIRCLIG
jgi:hypothetical protein